MSSSISLYHQLLFIIISHFYLQSSGSECPTENCSSHKRIVLSDNCRCHFSAQVRRAMNVLVTCYTHLRAKTNISSAFFKYGNNLPQTLQCKIYAYRPPVTLRSVLGFHPLFVANKWLSQKKIICGKYYRRFIHLLSKPPTYNSAATIYMNTQSQVFCDLYHIPAARRKYLPYVSEK